MTKTVDVTDRQLELYRFIRRFIEEKHYPPTRQEICDSFGWTSPNAAEQHLRALERKGAITISRGISRGIVLLDALPEAPPPTSSTRRPERK